jgi:c-di-GMP-binding flagellar brake protein YcgR
MVKSPQEKRKFFRHPITAPLKLQLAREENLVFAETQDLSLGGLSFFWKKRLSRGSIINISIPIKDKLFRIKSRVAYSKEDRKSGRFRTGVSFMDFPGAFKAKMAEEALEIMEYRKKLSESEHRDVTEEEASRRWIQKFADHFSD